MAIYLDFAGAIKGGSTTTDHIDWIPLSSLSFGVSRSISNVDGGGDRELSTPNFGEMVCTMDADVSITELQQQATMGKSLGEALIHFCNTSGENAHKPYQIYTLGEPIITSFSMSSGGDRPSVSFTINYSKIVEQWIKFTDGGGEEPGEEKGFDLKLGDPT